MTGFARTVGLAPPWPSPRPSVNVVQAMTIAGVSRRTIYNWVRGHKVEFFRTPGGGLRIYTDSLKRGER